MSINSLAAFLSSKPSLPGKLPFQIEHLRFSAHSRRDEKYKTRISFLLLAILAVIITGVANTSRAEEPLGLPSVRIPKDNLQTPEKITLGKRLFDDKRLSADGTLSCSSCHNPDKGFTDGLPVAQGIGKSKGTRNTPTLLNAAFYAAFFWDGRRPSLEEQALDPFVNSIEHGLKDYQAVLDSIRKDGTYPAQFKKVFGVAADKIEMGHVTKALAAFERTLISGNSPFDRYQYGGDKTALSTEAVRGLELFRTKALCVSCHTIGGSYATFTDNLFRTAGVGFEEVELNMFQSLNVLRIGLDKGQNLDELILKNPGISQMGHMLANSKISKLGFKTIGGFKTPTLRNVALTAPYMHDGSIATLEEVVELFNRGGQGNLKIDPLIQPLNLSPEEKSDLVAFMKSLTSPDLPQINTRLSAQ